VRNTNPAAQVGTTLTVLTGNIVGSQMLQLLGPGERPPTARTTRSGMGITHRIIIDDG